MKLAKLGDGPEIFHTLQGEGVSSGQPAVFVRLSLCNLHCVWCDTDHTWNFENTPWKHEKDEHANYTKHKKSEVIIDCSEEEIAQTIRRFACNRVIITGGEPLLQAGAILKLISILRADEKAWFFEIESNGTQLPNDRLMHEIDQFNISPKLGNSGVAEALRLNPNVLSQLNISGKAWFKFVVQSLQDIEEIEELIILANIDKQRVLLMPEGRSTQEIDQLAPWLAEQCRDRGFRFSDRLHVRLWGDERGR